MELYCGRLQCTSAVSRRLGSSQWHQRL